MPAAPADSALYRDLFNDDETARLFTDSAEVRALLLVEGALAKVQGELGLIPADAAAFLHRACTEVLIDPAALAAETAINGVPVPALIKAFHKTSNAPDHAQYLHWGATSQDIIDTALALRLKRVLHIWEGRLGTLLQSLAALADVHADLPIAARTYAQIATPTSFGAVVAGWGWPLLAHRARLADIRGGVLKVSLGGAAGTLSAMGPMGPQVRHGLSQALGLDDPGHNWHAQRDGIAALSGWIAGLSGSLGKMAEDLILLTQSGLTEVKIGSGGASSTMPQKQNPIALSVMVALARQVIGLSATLQGAAMHRQNRDGAAWFTEWLTLPQMCISISRLLALATDVAQRLTPDPVAMLRGVDGGTGVIHAEMLCFALARQMGRPDAQRIAATLSIEAETTGIPLRQLAERDFPHNDWATKFAPNATLGQAPAEARAFAVAARQDG